MAYVLRERGEWRARGEMCRELIADGTAVWVAEGLLGAIHCFEGRYGAARRMLNRCLTVAARTRHYNMTVDSTRRSRGSLPPRGRVEAPASTAGRCSSAGRTRRPPLRDRRLRWATAYFAGQGDRGARTSAPRR